MCNNIIGTDIAKSDITVYKIARLVGGRFISQYAPCERSPIPGHPDDGTVLVYTIGKTTAGWPMVYATNPGKVWTPFFRPGDVVLECKIRMGTRYMIGIAGKITSRHTVYIPEKLDVIRRIA